VIAVFIAATSSSASAGGCDHLLAMSMRRCHDDDRVDEGVVEQRHRIGVRARYVELGGNVLRDGAGRVGDRDQTRFGNSPREVTCIHAPQATKPNQPHVQSAHSACVSGCAKRGTSAHRVTLHGYRQRLPLASHRGSHALSLDNEPRMSVL
jgi:hypothetical protein